MSGKTFTILVVDGEKKTRDGIARSLQKDGYNAALAARGDDAWERYRQGGIDLVITGLELDGLSGEELLKRIKQQTPGVAVIIIAATGRVEDAVEAMRNGAWDFLAKPIYLDRLSILVKRALDNRERFLKNQRTEQELASFKHPQAMIGRSPAMERVLDTISRVGPTKASILITGESGVGKELVADAIHAASPRKDKPLVKVHCAAFPESLLESELFGHEKGAFTGAAGMRKGRFEMADGGTLFLDEIGEVDQNVQIKLLRVLQEHTFERVGGEETIEVDIRLVAATNRNLLEEIERGRFREDLYYRLNVVTITVPPLRERKDDIPLLIDTYLKKFTAENEKKISGLSERARNILYNYEWPGNIRELRNCIESAVVMAKGRLITETDLPPTLHHVSDGTWIQIPMGSTLEEAERKIILATLAAKKNNKSAAASVLGIGRKTLLRKLGNEAKEAAAAALS